MTLEQMKLRSVRLMAAPGSGAGPATLNEDARSVEVVAATESPTPMIDYKTWELVPEILRMDGVQIPDSGQVPLLDSHRNRTTAAILGSLRNIRVEGDKLIGLAVFADTPAGKEAFDLVRAGHLTDFSVGYLPDETAYARIAKGATARVAGRDYTGPVNVAARWSLYELSACPIGADENAKARSRAKGDDTMNEALRKKLVARGMPPTATDEEALDFLDTLEPRGRAAAEPPASAPPAQAPAAASIPTGPESNRAAPDDMTRMILEEDRKRAAEIRAMCEKNRCPDLVDQAISKGWTLDATRAIVLERIQARAAGQALPGFSVEAGATEMEKFRAVALEGLLLRCGRFRGEKSDPLSKKYQHMPIRQLAEECLSRAGVVPPSYPMEMIGRAFTSSDFPILLANLASMTLAQAYAEAAETWDQVFDTGQVSDFKINTLARASEFDDLDEIPEGAEYKYGSLGEGKEQFKIDRYGKLFAISYQAMVDNNLTAFTDTLPKMGAAYRRKIGDVAWSVLMANGIMGDGNPLFHANHNNLASSGTVLSDTSLTAAFLAMSTQKDIGGKARLNIRPVFYLAPPSLMGSSESFFRTDNFEDVTVSTGTTITKKVNIYSGQVLTRVYESRLYDYDVNAWFLAGAKGQTVRVFFLNGQTEPRLESKEGWSRDVLEFKVSGNFAAAALDWRALFLNPGA